MNYIVQIEDTGSRLDKFLSKNSDKSRTKLQEAIKTGFVSINNTVVMDPAIKLKFEQVVTLRSDIPIEPIALAPEKIDFKVVYEDNDILVIDKPAGLVVHPGCGNFSGTLVNGLLYYSKNLSMGSDLLRPGIVHRIDKDTSGILVIAKNDFAHMHLAQQFAEHTITRKYICFVYNTPKINSNLVTNLGDNTYQISANIGRDTINRQKMAIVENGGKVAITQFRILKKYCTQSDVFASKIECNLKTGRTHQIRVHLTSLGASLIGDQTYGRKKKLPIDNADFIYKFPRQALHAFYLKIIHPRSSDTIEFQSSYPNDLIELENNLNQN